MKECKAVENKSNNEDFCSDLGRELETKDNGRGTYFSKLFRERTIEPDRRERKRKIAVKIAHRFAKGQLN